MTTEEEKDALVKLVEPWLPGASIDTLDISESCGCYSEWTTEAPSYFVTFKAPRPSKETDRELSDIVRVLEGKVLRFARYCHDFDGCSCCDGTDNPSLYVRIIPEKVK